MVWVLVFQRICGYERLHNGHADTISSLRKIGKVYSTDDIEDEFATDSDKDLVSCRDVVNVRAHRKIHYAARVALLAKAEVGLMSNTKASQLVYQRICRDEMIKHGVRPTHIARILPLAVAACLVKTDEDYLAESMLQEIGKRDSPMGGGCLGK